MSETPSAKAAPALPRRPLLVLHAERTVDGTGVAGAGVVKPGDPDDDERYAHAAWAHRAHGDPMPCARTADLRPLGK